MSKIAIIFAGIALIAAPALAQQRPYSPRMSCAATAGLVASRGAVVIGTGPSLYNRYVRDRRFCTPSETTRTAFIPTADNPQCFVGYTCEESEREMWPF
jgi:hypothetical protein